MQTSRIFPPTPEMRRFKRQAISDIIAVMHSDGGASVASGRDMSENSLYFSSDAAFPRGSELELLVPSSFGVLLCKGTVVRTEFDPLTASFGIAVLLSSTTFSP